MVSEASELFATIIADPTDTAVRLVYADCLEEHGECLDARLWRELSRCWDSLARQRIKRVSVFPKDQSALESAIDPIPAEYRSVFAAGCALRCGLWIPEEYAAEQAEDTREILIDLATPTFGDEMKTRYDAAWSRYNAAWSRYDAAWSRADAAWSRYDAAGSRADAAGSRANAAWSRADAAGSRANAAWSRYDAAGSRADAAGSRANAAGSRANAAWSRANAAWSRYGVAGLRANAAWSRESRWQARWLSAVKLIGGW